MIERIDVWTAGVIGHVNPGGSMGWGMIVKRNDEVLAAERGLVEPSKDNTNVVAEYIAVCRALSLIQAKQFFRHQVRVYSDNFIIVQRMNGHWHLKGKGMDGRESELHGVALAIRENFRNLVFSLTSPEANFNARDLARKPLEERGIPFYIHPLKEPHATQADQH